VASEPLASGNLITGKSFGMKIAASSSESLVMQRTTCIGPSRSSS